jgi:hypothetical protein
LPATDPGGGRCAKQGYRMYGTEFTGMDRMNRMKQDNGQRLPFFHPVYPVHPCLRVVSQPEAEAHAFALLRPDLRH